MSTFDELYACGGEIPEPETPKTVCAVPTAALAKVFSPAASIHDGGIVRSAPPVALTAALSHLACDEEAEAPPPGDRTGCLPDDDGAFDDDYVEGDDLAATGGAPRKFRGVWCVSRLHGSRGQRSRCCVSSTGASCVARRVSCHSDALQCAGWTASAASACPRPVLAFALFQRQLLLFPRPRLTRCTACRYKTRICACRSAAATPDGRLQAAPKGLGRHSDAALTRAPRHRFRAGISGRTLFLGSHYDETEAARACVPPVSLFGVR